MPPCLCGSAAGRTNLGRRQIPTAVVASGEGGEPGTGWEGAPGSFMGRQERAEWPGVWVTQTFASVKSGTAQICTF